MQMLHCHCEWQWNTQKLCLCGCSLQANSLGERNKKGNQPLVTKVNQFFHAPLCKYVQNQNPHFLMVCSQRNYFAKSMHTQAIYFCLCNGSGMNMWKIYSLLKSLSQFKLKTDDTNKACQHLSLTIAERKRQALIPG